MENGETANISENIGRDQSIEHEVERIINEHNNENANPHQNLPPEPSNTNLPIPRKIPKDSLYRGTKTSLPEDFLRVIFSISSISSLSFFSCVSFTL